jgi:hypothetical protein
MLFPFVFASLEELPGEEFSHCKWWSQDTALTLALGRVSMKIGDQQTCTSGGRDSAGDDRVPKALS